jgi:predicted CXXCH cytochrome family protein
MRKITSVALATGLLALTGTAVYAALNEPVNGASVPGSGIRYTRHDLSSTGLAAHYANDGLDRICIYCHAPHHTLKHDEADTLYNLQYVPLWNHEVTVETYELYNNGSDEPTDAAHASYAKENSQDVGSVSRLCLSCHDGTVAVNQYGFAPSNATNAGTTNLKGTAYEIGGADQYGYMRLDNHHPVGFNYQAAYDSEQTNGRGELAQTTASMGAYTIGDLLWGGNMECSTCHDVHNSQNTGEKFLWISDSGSAFCLTCHLK